MLFMDINDSMIFKESPVRQDIPVLDHKNSGSLNQYAKTNQETAELENIISDKDKLIEKMKDEFESA